MLYGLDGMIMSNIRDAESEATRNCTRKGVGEYIWGNIAFTLVGVRY
jgi:hypothetical protein